MKARYNSTRDVDKANRMFMMHEKHLCWGCPYGTALSDRFLCMFIDGSCAKFPETIEKPDAEFLSKMVIRSIRKP